MTRRLLLIATVICLMLIGTAIAETRESTPLTPGVAAEAVIETAGEIAYFSYTPSENGMYVWYSTADSDTYGYLYDSGMNELARNDDSGGNGNFKIQYTLIAGSTYYFGARYYDTSSQTGSFGVELDEYHGLISARTAADQNNFTVKPNETVTLEVSATTTDGSLTYEWKNSVTGEIIRGANAAAITIENPAAYERIHCTVSDDYGHSKDVQFYITINNELEISSVGETTVYVVPNGSATMAVDASCLFGGLTYQWYGSSGIIEGAVSNTYATDAVSTRTEYRCTVSDEYGSEKSIWFTVNIDNDFTAEAIGDTSISAAPESTVTLAVSASCRDGSLIYEWYDPFTGETTTGSETYTTSPITSNDYYSCKVSDMYGNSKSIQFYIRIDNQFTVAADGNTGIYVAPGTAVTLSINASCLKGDIEYQWYTVTADYNSSAISGATSSTYEISSVNYYAQYYCEVKDAYASQKRIDFKVGVENGFQAAANGSFGPDDWKTGGGVSYRFFVPYHGDATATVTASCTVGELTYEWKDINWDILEETGPSLAVTDVTRHVYLFCTVRDMYGNSKEFEFDIMPDPTITTASTEIWINGEQVQTATDDQTIIVSPGDSIRLISHAEAGNLVIEEYEFYVQGTDDYTTDANTCTVDNIVNPLYIECVAVTDFANSSTLHTIGFEFDNDLTVAPAGDTVVHVSEGETVTLTVEASARTGDFTYSWISNYNIYSVLSDTASITVTADNSSAYTCTVTDTYGNIRTVDFLVLAGASKVLPLDQETKMLNTSIEHGTAYLSFTPTQSGHYRIETKYSQDYTYDAECIASLYQGAKRIAKDNMYWRTGTVQLEKYLNAGTEYVYLISYKDLPDTTVFILRCTDEVEASDFSYDIVDGNAVITGYTGSDTEVVIPAEINGYAATKIGNAAFMSNESIVSVIIPDGVTKIGYDAFAECTGLTGIIIPDSVTSFGFGAFRNCSNLEQLVIPPYLTDLGECAFSGCGKLTSLSIPATVTRIGFEAFAGTAITEITLPEGAEIDYASLFEGCTELRRVVVPESFNGGSSAVAFLGCSNLTEIVIPESNTNSCTVDGVVYDKSVTELIFCPAGLTQAVIIPDTVTTIGWWAFNGCSKLTEITIPASVTTISDDAFTGCRDDLTFFVIENSYAQQYAIDHGINYIVICEFTYELDGDNAIITGYTGQESSVMIPEEVEGYPVIAVTGTCGDFTYTYNCAARSLTISGVGAMPDMELFGYPWYVYSIEQCATSVILEPGMTHIGEYAFLEFTKMTECILPNTVTSIGMAAFGACRSMPAFDLPDSITVIGLSAFDNCESMTSFTIPPRVTLLDYDTFMNCTNLQTVILPEGMTTIRPGAFRECISLADVKIPASVTFIEEGAFPAFDQAYIRCVAGSYAHDYAVRNSVAIKELIDPGFSSNMTLPSALKTIEAEAFSGIAAAGVTVPDGTTSIGSKAFANCPNLKMIRIPASVQTIAADAFEGDGIILIYGTRNSAAETFAATSDYLCFFEAQ